MPVLGSPSPALPNVPDGVAKLADGQTDLLGFWQSFIDHLAHGDPDALLIVNPVDEQSVLRDGATLYSNSLGYFWANATDRASIVAGAGPIRKAIQPVATHGVGQWPISGCMATDQFIVQFKLKPVGQSLLLTGVGGSFVLTFLAAVAGLNRLEIVKVNAAGNASFTLSASISVDERGFMSPGSNNFVTTSIATLNDSDFPVDAWTSVAVTFDGTTLRLIVGDNAKSATATYSGAWLKRPWDGDPMWSAGLFVGAGGVTPPAGATAIAISDAAVYRWSRTYGQQLQRKRPTLAVAPQNTQGMFPRNLAGVVGHYTGWADNEAGEAGQTAARDRQIGLATSAGLPLVRIAEFHARAIPTLSNIPPGSITSIDWSGWDAHLARWNWGCDATLHIGYVPAAFGGGANGFSEPAVAGLTATQVNTLYADYASQAMGRAKAILGAAHIKSIAFWNEPENFGIPAWTAGRFYDLFSACSIKLATDHPDLPRLGTPDSSSSGLTTWWKGVVDRAQTDGLALGSCHLHDYDNCLTKTWEHLDDQRSYLDFKGFTTTPQYLSEWNYRVNWPQQLPRLQSLEHRPTTEFNATWVHTMIEMLARRGGVNGAAFFRLGRQATISLSAAGEESNGLIDNGVNGRPTPAWCAFELLWKHAATKISASSNYPNWGVLASKDMTTGRIVVTYHHRTLNKAMTLRAANIEWGTLPATFTWKHWVVDAQTVGMGSPLLVASGTQANLPSFVLPRSHMAVGCIEISP